MKYLPGVPEDFSKNFTIQVAHFEPDEIRIHGSGVFPRISLDLPRNVDPEGNYQELETSARENLAKAGKRTVKPSERPGSGLMGSHRQDHIQVRDQLHQPVACTVAWGLLYSLPVHWSSWANCWRLLSVVGGAYHPAPGAGGTDGTGETVRQTVCPGSTGTDVGSPRPVRCHTPRQQREQGNVRLQVTKEKENQVGPPAPVKGFISNYNQIVFPWYDWTERLLFVTIIVKPMVDMFQGNPCLLHLVLHQCESKLFNIDFSFAIAISFFSSRYIFFTWVFMLNFFTDLGNG